MVDFGKLPRTLLLAITEVCGHADAYVKRIKDTSWADNIPVDDLPLWEQFLNIYSEGLDIDGRRAAVLAYLNAKGSPRVIWFYELAARLGYQRGHYNQHGVWNVNGGTWDTTSAVVYFTDGEFLPFRTDISMTGDMVYDNVDYGATTCRCFYRRGNAETGLSRNDLSLQLKDLVSIAKSLGTKILFVDTDI